MLRYIFKYIAFCVLVVLIFFRSANFQSRERIIGILLLLTFILSFCSIVYELIIASTLTFISDNIVLWYSLTIGSYILFLGLGAFVYEKIKQKEPMKLLIWVEVFLCILGASVVPTLFLFEFLSNFLAKELHFLSGTTVYWIQALIFQIPTMVIGFLSGFELPALMDLYQRKTKSSDASKVLAFNYIGALFGTLFLAFIFLPKLDVILTGAAIALLNFVCLLILASLHWQKPFTLKALWFLPLLFWLTLPLKYESQIYQFFLKSFYQF